MNGTGSSEARTVDVLMGWAARSKKKRQGTFRELSVEDYANTARMLREGLSDYGLAADPNTTVGKMAKDAQWIADFGVSPFGPGGAGAADKQRFLRAFPRMIQARNVARLLQWARRVENGQDLVRTWIRKRIDVIETQEEEAQDHLFELEIAARLASWPGIDVKLEEPDITVKLPDAEERLAFACKRPRSIKSLRDRLVDARDQVRASHLPGVIVIGLDSIFHRSADPKRRTITYLVPTPKEAKEEGERIVDEAVSAAKGIEDRVFDAAVGGALFIGLLTYISERPSAVGYAWMRGILPNRRVPNARAELEGLDYLLFEDLVSK